MPILIKSPILLLFAVSMLATSTARSYERPVSIGVNANFEQNLAQTAHLGWSRIDIPWSRVNPSSGVWDWAFTDAEINNARSWGQQILAVLHYPPQWVGGGPNENIAPLSTTQWAEFVRRAAQRYQGKIAAYEIWNEPDDAGTSSLGIGWGRAVGEPPLYVDFLHTAANEIRANDPAALVGGPALKSRNTPNATSNRKNGIWGQIANAAYPDGYGYQFLNFSSFHNNAANDEPSATMAFTLYNENILIRNNLCLLCQGSIWVTEYGFRSNAVGETGQREKICNLTRSYTGRLNPGYLGCLNCRVERAFIFVLKITGSSASIFNGNNTPKPVVTQYLQQLAYPAVQNPAVSADFPNCATGALAADSSWVEGEEAWDALGTLGLADPRAALPREFSEDSATFDFAAKSFDARFEDGDGGQLSIRSTSLDRMSKRRGEESSTNLRWEFGGNELEVVGSAHGQPLGASRLREIATALTGSRQFGCRREWIEPTPEQIKELGFKAPGSPKGFRPLTSRFEVSRLTSECDDADGATAPLVDLTWSFESRSGAIVQAGVYRYEDTVPGNVSTETSLHWMGTNAARYWVAAAPDSVGEVPSEVLTAIARSLDDHCPF